MDTAQAPAPLPRTLADALRTGRLTVVAGAGISMLAPSSLPSWWGFNVALLDAIKQSALNLLPRPQPGQPGLLDALTLDGGIPVVAFSDHLVRSFAGQSYFPLLGLLESSRPNANHRALAELARRGALRHIVTPNFDTLIERAFREAGVPLEVLIGRDSPGALGGRGRAATVLHKIHGSASDEASLVDTVSQKLRGLSPEQRAALAAAFADCHVLFIGFSGADFAFDADYLPLRQALHNGQSFTWVSRPGSAPPDIARQMARSPDWLLEGELPQWYVALGLEAQTWQALDGVPTAAVPAAAEPTIAARIAQWIDQPAFGPWACAALCLRLLNGLLQRAQAQAFEAQLSAALEAALQQPTGVTPGAGAAMRQLMSSAAQRGDWATARTWCERELQFLEALRRLATHRGPATEAAAAEHLRNMASVWINLALMWRHDRQAPGRDAALAQAMEQANSHATAAQDPGLLALLSLAHGQDSRLPFAARLLHLRTAQAWARQAGSHQSQIEALQQQAQLSMTLVELDQAQAALDAAQALLPLDTGPALNWTQQQLQTRLAAHRADVPAALQACARMQEQAGGDLALQVETARELLRGLGWAAAADPAVQARWQMLLLTVRSLGAGPADALEAAWAQVLAAGRQPPAFLPPWPAEPATAAAPDEGTWQARLAWAEFQRDDAACLACLEALCAREQARGRDRAWRLADLALALQTRALQAVRPVTVMVAGNYLGIAHELATRLQPAAQAWRAALQTPQAAGEPAGLRATIQANLARIVAQQGEAAEAQAMFEAARAALHACASWNSYYTATVNHARLFGQQGQPDAAAQLLQEAAVLAGTQGDAALAAALQQLASEFASGVASPNTRLRQLTPADSWQRQAERHGVAAGPLDAAASAEQIATAAMAHWEVGEEALARRLNQQARELYEQRGDLAGLSRCWNNLATMQMAAGDDDGAIESTRLALALRMRTDDVAGQVRTQASLAAQCLKKGLPGPAQQLADSGLVLAQSSLAEPADVVQLQLTGLQAVLAQRRWADGRARAARLQDLLAGVEPRDRARVEAALRDALDLLDEVERLLQAAPVEVSPRALAQLRQAQTGQPADAISLLQAALLETAEPGWTGIERGTLQGELANLLAAADVPAALLQYEQSARSYEQAGRGGMAWHARGLAAILRVKGQGAQPETLLAFARSCPEPMPALNVLTGCAQALFERARQDDQAALPWSELRMLLAERIEAGQADAETLGRAALQWMRACMAEGDLQAARLALAQARQHLTRSNSRYVDQLPLFEQSLQQAQADAAAQTTSTGASSTHR